MTGDINEHDTWAIENMMMKHEVIFKSIAFTENICTTKYSCDNTITRTDKQLQHIQKNFDGQ